MSDINDDKGYLNGLLNHVPWSETLIETRIGILSVIILTNYATTSFITEQESQTLQGQMYIYNPKSYEYYSTKLKNSTNFHFSRINESDDVFVYPIRKYIVSPTISSFITSRLPTNNTAETTRSSYTTKTVQDKPTSNILTILLICGTMCVFFIIFFIGVFIYCKRKRSNPDNVPFHRVSERTSQKDLVHEELGYIEPIVDKWELTWNKLVAQNVIGSGAYGQIMQGKLCKANGVKEDEIGVALKMPSKLATELEKMKKISGNINIVQMHGCITDGDRICLVLELCQNLDLFKYVKKVQSHLVNNDKSVSTKKDFFRFLWQISHGLQYLAKKSIVHRDLAARNILIDLQNNAKIADFGLSLQLIDSTFIIPDREREKLPIKWLAIESFKMYKFSLKTDVWTFGIVLYEMYSFGEIPYADIDASELLDYLEAGNRLNKPEFCPDEIFEIMLKCWIENPFKRPAIEEIITNFSLLVKCYGKDYENYISGTHFSSEM